MKCISPVDGGRCTQVTDGVSKFCKQHSNSFRSKYLKYKNVEASLVQDPKTIYDFLKNYNRLGKAYKLRVEFRKEAISPEAWDQGHDIRLKVILKQMNDIVDKIKSLFSKSNQITELETGEQKDTELDDKIKEVLVFHKQTQKTEEDFQKQVSEAIRHRKYQINNFKEYVDKQGRKMCIDLEIEFQHDLYLATVVFLDSMLRLGEYKNLVSEIFFISRKIGNSMWFLTPKRIKVINEKINNYKDLIVDISTAIKDKPFIATRVFNFSTHTKIFLYDVKCLCEYSGPQPKSCFGLANTYNIINTSTISKKSEIGSFVTNSAIDELESQLRLQKYNELYITLSRRYLIGNNKIFYQLIYNGFDINSKVLIFDHLKLDQEYRIIQNIMATLNQSDYNIKEIRESQEMIEIISKLNEIKDAAVLNKIVRRLKKLKNKRDMIQYMGSWIS